MIDGTNTEVSHAKGDLYIGVASDDTVERIDKGVRTNVVLERREGEGLDNGVIFAVDIAFNLGKGSDVEGIWEVAGNKEGRVEFEGILLPRSDEAGGGSEFGHIGAIVSIGDNSFPNSVGAIVMDEHLGSDGLPIGRCSRIGDGYDAAIIADGSTADMEIVNGTSFTKGAGARGTHRCSVDESELQKFGEVARDARTVTGYPELTIRGTRSGTVEDSVITIIVPCGSGIPV